MMFNNRVIVNRHNLNSNNSILQLHIIGRGMLM